MGKTVNSFCSKTLLLQMMQIYLLARNPCPGIKRELEIQGGISCPIAIVGQVKGPYSGRPKQAQGYINGGELTA